MALRHRHGWLGCALAAAWLVAAPPAGAQAVHIDTVAGTGAAGWLDGPARKAALNGPYQLASLADGSLLIADYLNNRIRKLAGDGTLSTVAGTGTASSGPDGGQATNTAINAPLGVAVAPDGATFYLSESGGHRIRRVDPDGTITTVAGGVGGGYNGDGIPSLAAQVNYPFGLGTDGDGDLYIADMNNGRVRHVAANAGGIVDGVGTITTVASGIAAPTGVFANPDGSLVVASFGAHRLYSIDADGTATVLAGTGAQCGGTGTGSAALCGDGGPAANAPLSNPLYVIGDGAGGYYFSDRGSYRVRHIAPAPARTISTVAGTGTGCVATGLCGDGGAALSAQLPAPSGLALSAGGALYVADFAVHRVRLIAPLAPTAPDGPAGPDGPQGPSGPPGPAGADGADGADGAPGAPGAPGSAGAGGLDGAPGRAGTPGRDGAGGAAGHSGASGRDATWSDLTTMQVLLPSRAIMSRPVRRAWVRLFVSGASDVEVTLHRNGRVVKRVKRRFKRIGRKRFNMGRLGRGTYDVRVLAVARRSGTAISSSSVDRDTAELVVR